MDAQQRDDLARLLERSADDDVRAFSDYFDRTIGEALRLARLSVAARPGGAGGAIAEDVVHDMYQRAWVDRALYRSSALSPRAWILSFVHESVDAVGPARES